MLEDKKIENTQEANSNTVSNSVTPEAQASDKPHFARKPGEFLGKPGGFKSKQNGQKPFKKMDNPYEEKVVAINRVTKVTKGGRRFRFAAVVVIGDKKGKVGLGTGKANEVPDAIKKAIKEARKTLIRVPIVGTTVPHETLGHYGAGRVLIKPAKKGTGVIAGGPARAVIELAGISDVYTKSLGSNTPINMIRATLEGLQSMKTSEQIMRIRESKTPLEKEQTVDTKSI